MKYSELDIKELSDDQIYELVMSEVVDISKTKADEKSSPDMLLVLGASPVPMKARIVKAMQLYQNGYGKYLVLSGGTGWHKLFKPEERKFRDEAEMFTYYKGKKQKYKQMKRALQRTLPEEFKHKSKKGKALYKYMHRKLEQNLEMTEAEIGCKILGACKEIVDIDEDAIFVEKGAKNTPENIRFSVEMMRDLAEQGKIDDIKSVMIITSSFHCKRAELTFKSIFTDIDVIVCPATQDLDNNRLTLDKGSIMNSPYYRAQIKNELNAIINYTRNGSIADQEIPGFEIEEEHEI